MSSFKNPALLAVETAAVPLDRSAMSVPQRLWQAGMFAPLNYVLQGHGKRIRAELVELAFLCNGGQGQIPRALTDFFERLHGGSLIIDDIEDDSWLRRGKPTLHRVVGVPLAINTGNWMYFSALEQLQSLPLDAAAKNQVFAKALDTIRRCHEGQALDLASKVQELASHEFYPTVVAISQLKTGGLTALAAELGATVGGASEEVGKIFHAFGMHLGVGLQMQNDLEELKHAAAQNGRYDDLRNGRVTWPWAWASQQMGEVEFADLQSSLSDPSVGNLQAVAVQLREAVIEVAESNIGEQLQKAVAGFRPAALGERADDCHHWATMSQLLGRIERYYV